MIGKNRDGGFAEFICVPARSVFRLGEAISAIHGAVMMCSTATAYHALRRARLVDGDRVAVFGVGGLGASAIQLAQALGAAEVYAVDVVADKLAWAEKRGAIAVDAARHDAADVIADSTGGMGVDVSLEFAGRPESIDACIRSTGVHGRAAMVALTDRPSPVQTYRDLVAREMEIVGVSDHLPSDIDEVLRLYRSGALDLSDVVTRTVPLAAQAINQMLDELESGAVSIRTVVVPESS
jgi:propanol-preferring alcohol dehydrogenase